MNSNIYNLALLILALSSSALHAKTESEQSTPATANEKQAITIDDRNHPRLGRNKLDAITMLQTIISDIEHEIANAPRLANKSDCAISLYLEIRRSEIHHIMHRENYHSFVEYNDLNMKSLEDAANSILLDDEERELLFEKLAKNAEETKRNYPQEYKLMGNYIESLLLLWEKSGRAGSQKPDKPSSDDKTSVSTEAADSDNLSFEQLPKSVQTFLISYVKSFLIAEIDMFNTEGMDMEKMTAVCFKDTGRILSEIDSSKLPESYKVFINRYIALCNNNPTLSAKSKVRSALTVLQMSLLENLYTKEFNLIADRASVVHVILERYNLNDYRMFLFYTNEKVEEEGNFKRLARVYKQLVKAIEKRSAINNRAQAALNKTQNL